MIRPSHHDASSGHDSAAGSCPPISPPPRPTWRAALRGHVAQRHLQRCLVCDRG
jgi:hypothetical protein